MDDVGKCVAHTLICTQCIIINKIIITVLVSLSHVCCVGIVYIWRKVLLLMRKSFFLLLVDDGRCRVIHSDQLFILLFLLLLFVLMADFAKNMCYLDISHPPRVMTSSVSSSSSVGCCCCFIIYY